MYIPHGTTYNDLLKEYTLGYRVRRDEIPNKLGRTFKRTTGISIGDLVTKENYPEVIEGLDNSRHDHVCFASWLSSYTWKTPLQAECGDAGYTYVEWQDIAVQAALNLERFDSDVDEEIEDDDWGLVSMPKTELEPLKVIDVFTKAYGESYDTFRLMSNFLKADWSRFYHPWTVLELSDILVLRKWLGASYPSYGLCGNDDIRFKADYLKT